MQAGGGSQGLCPLEDEGTGPRGGEGGEKLGELTAQNGHHGEHKPASQVSVCQFSWGYFWRNLVSCRIFYSCQCLKLYPPQRAAISVVSLVPLLQKISKMEELFEGPPVSHNLYIEIHLTAYHRAPPMCMDCARYCNSASSVFKK